MKHLFKSCFVNRGVSDWLKTMPAKKVCLEGEAKESFDSQGFGACHQSIQNYVADALTLKVGVDHDAAHLGQVLPHYVKCPTTNHAVIGVDSNQHLLNLLIHFDFFSAEQDPTLDPWPTQGVNRRYVGGPSSPNAISHKAMLANAKAPACGEGFAYS